MLTVCVNISQSMKQTGAPMNKRRSGLGSNYLLGFWQADPIVGLIIVMFLFREGLEGWKESKEERGDRC